MGYGTSCYMGYDRKMNVLCTFVCPETRGMYMKIKKCSCGYTMKDVCEKCGKTRTAHPPKFSSSDKYARYRRLAKNNTA